MTECGKPFVAVYFTERPGCSGARLVLYASVERNKIRRLCRLLGDCSQVDQKVEHSGLQWWGVWQRGKYREGRHGQRKSEIEAQTNTFQLVWPACWAGVDLTTGDRLRVSYCNTSLKQFDKADQDHGWCLVVRILRLVHPIATLHDGMPVRETMRYCSPQTSP
ncbi:hypothetical protein RRG08_042393 [Elysia crispata]|uniref:Uncharacterized protein n=1 Tax=Elysia crispata TaxID=231223 RepID=A0AAE0ZC09_9GAST|nr:hypothetical protein RRG08_042393 [Elysia crispata]